MSPVEIIGFIISLLALVFLFFKNKTEMKSVPVEEEEEDDDPLRNFMKTLEKEMREEEPPPPPPPPVILPRPQKKFKSTLEERKLKSKIEERKLKSNLEKRYHVKEETVPKKKNHRLPKLRDMVIYHTIMKRWDDRGPL